MAKFILLHTSEKAPIVFNIDKIISYQPKSNGCSGSTETIIITVNDCEMECEKGIYTVIETFEEITNKLKTFSVII